MPRNIDITEPDDFSHIFRARNPWRRLAVLWGGLAIAALIALLIFWNALFKYVPAGKHLVITAQNGSDLDPGEKLANEGQKGVQRHVKSEGWHFVMPIVYTAELEDNTIIPAGKIGILTALGGKPLPASRVLAEEGEQGIQRSVLAPGAYRINLHGYQVDLAEATEIKPGFVGVVRRLLGDDAQSLFAREGSAEKGYLPKVLQPGIYYLNTKEFEVIKVEVGIFQTNFHTSSPGEDEASAITFTSKGGFPISIDCTVEWEVLPEYMPNLVAEYGTRKNVEKKVISVQAHAIGRDKGITYGIQDFLEGSTRERFQESFTQELTRVCKAKNVTIHSAFIRRIDIPEQYLKPIRDKQIAAETELTTKAKEVTAETENQVETEERKIQFEVEKVQALTKQMVANIDQEVKNIKVRTDAEIEKLKAEYGSKIAALEADKTQLLGQTEAEVSKLQETAKSNLYKLKLDVFQSDNSAFLRYTLAKELNPNLVLRLFHSGTGTFWTNMGDKNLNLMLPATGGPEKAERTKTVPVKEDKIDARK
jgi:regulator of protease activity HflC (stomatin/prohibitin superfamily)